MKKGSSHPHENKAPLLGRAGEHSRFVLALEQVGIHDHLCLIYENLEEQITTIVPFLLIGLARGECCVYITDDKGAEDILLALRGNGVDVDAVQKSGALSVVSEKDVCQTGGLFDSERTIDFFQSSADAAKAAGFSALRVASELPEVLLDPTKLERLRTYVDQLNDFLASIDALILHQHHWDRFSQDSLRGVIEVYPVLIYGSAICQNIYYIPSSEFFAPADVAKDTRRHLNNLVAVQQISDERNRVEEFTDTALNAQVDTFFLFDPATEKAIRWNRAFREVSGYSDAEISKLPALATYYGPKDLGRATDFMLRNLTRGYGTIELDFLCKDGHTIPTEYRVSVIENGEGKPRFLIAIGRDISERKLAEQEQAQRLEQMTKSRQAMLYMLEDLNESSHAIEQAKEQWEETFDAVTDPIFIHDQDHRIIRANRAYGEQAGVAVKDVIGKPYWQVFPKGNGPLASCEKALQSGAAEETIPENGAVFEIHSFALHHEDHPDLSIHFMEDVTERKHAGEALLYSHLQLQASLEGTIKSISAAVEARDPYTAGHQRRVAALAVRIARKMGVDDDTIHGIHMGGIIHDIGKIRLPAETLSKPTHLKTYEFELIKSHALSGYDILKDIDFPWPIAAIAHQHHERLDGKGYPQGLIGNQICLEARIVAVADVVEAMASDRPYRPGLGLDKAIAEISKNKGVSFDALAVEACIAVVSADGFDFDAPLD